MLGKCGHYPPAARMNAWGADGCLERFAVLVRWLREYACRHGQCMSLAAAERMIKLAIERARPEPSQGPDSS